MSDLERAIQISVEAHAGQRDKAGAPYVLHPLRLMFKMQTDAQRIAALLHDVVEDSAWTLDQLRKEGFIEEVLTAVACLTHNSNEPYDIYIERIAQNRLARVVKIADLQDNLDLTRLTNVREKDIQRIRKYQRSLAILLQASPE